MSGLRALLYSYTYCKLKLALIKGDYIEKLNASFDIR